MKKLFVFILALFFFYIHAGHNSVVAYSISKIPSQNTHCAQIHTPVEIHKCCFISDNKSENTPSSTVQTTIEKVKKQIFFTLNLDNVIIKESKTPKFYQPL